jgi:hypothetical protein
MEKLIKSICLKNIIINYLIIFNLYLLYIYKFDLWGLGIGDWGLGIGDWGLGIIIKSTIG